MIKSRLLTNQYNMFDKISQIKFKIYNNIYKQ